MIFKTESLGSKFAGSNEISKTIFKLWTFSLKSERYEIHWRERNANKWWNSGETNKMFGCMAAKKGADFLNIGQKKL